MAVHVTCKNKDQIMGQNLMARKIIFPLSNDQCYFFLKKMSVSFISIRKPYLRTLATKYFPH